MDWINHTVAALPRSRQFPFRVQMLYYSRSHFLSPTTCSLKASPFFEISLRLSDERARCSDLINGRQVDKGFPNVAWKLPGKCNSIGGSGRRDTLAFGYAPETLEEFTRLGMAPDADCTDLLVDEVLEGLILSLRRCFSKFHSPGIADRIDWLCFQIYHELLFQPHRRACPETPSENIRNMSIWFQTHYTENFNLDDIAENYGFSHTRFYQEWNAVFPESPLQYLRNLKLLAAGNLLISTDLLILQIVHEVNFSGSTAFHQAFRACFGISPQEFRHFFQARGQGVFSDLSEPLSILQAAGKLGKCKK